MKKRVLVGLIPTALALASCTVNVNDANVSGNISVEKDKKEEKKETPVEEKKDTSKEEFKDTTKEEKKEEIKEEKEEEKKEEIKEENKIIVNKGFATTKKSDFDQYLNTDAHVVVRDSTELLKAIKDAKSLYTTTYNEETKEVSQDIQSEGKIKVIEIANDIDLGYNTLTEEAKATGVVTDFDTKRKTKKDNKMSDMVTEHGISQVKIQNTSNLCIFSKNNAKLTHGGFQVCMDYNIVFDNLQMDEMWQWEDTTSDNPTFKVGDYDIYGWAYFKISFSGNVLINNCTFGKSYDGQIDISDPNYYYSKSVAELRAPLHGEEKGGITISNCKFLAGDASEDGYIYKMMKKIDDEYMADPENCTFRYYRALRKDYNLSFDEILHGIACGQKKGCLCGDRSNEYDYNYDLKVLFDKCLFKDLEDRLPKIRYGFAYMSNCLYDNSEYWKYRNIIEEEKHVSNIKNDARYGKKFKLASTSQGIVPSFGADVVADNCVFIGIKELIKNNEKYEGTDVDLSDELKAGGIMLINCIEAKDLELTNSQILDSTKTEYQGINLVNSKYFDWHNTEFKEGTKPEVISSQDLISYFYN